MPQARVEPRSGRARFGPFPRMPRMRGMNSERLYFEGRLRTWSPFARKVMSNFHQNPRKHPKASPRDPCVGLGTPMGRPLDVMGGHGQPIGLHAVPWGTHREPMGPIGRAWAPIGGPWGSWGSHLETHGGPWGANGNHRGPRGALYQQTPDQPHNGWYW